MSNQKKVKIKIFDKDFTLLVDNEDRAKQVGDYINGLMSDLKSDMADQPTQTVAMLVALNIANDMFSEKEDLEKLFIDLNQKIEKMNTLMEDVLKN